MEIREIAINHYGPLRDIRHRPRPGLQVFYGPNESGKTLLLDALLKLLLGKTLKDFKDIDRVPGPPQGWITMAHQGKEHIFDGKLLLMEVTGLSSSDLRNVFVIRNKDLQFSGQADYFRRLNDQLTGMEGRRLSRLKEVVRQRGRMTPSGTQLSKSQDFDRIGEKVAEALKLAAEMRKYGEEARSNRLDELEKQLEEGRLRQQTLVHEIKEQEAAGRWEEYEQLRNKVEEYARRSVAAERLLPYTKTKLMQLQDKESRSKANGETAAESREKLAQLLPLLAEAAAAQGESEVNLGAREGRKQLLDNLTQQSLAAAEDFPPFSTALAQFGLLFLGITGIALILVARNSLPTLLHSLPYATASAALLLLAIDASLRVRNRNSRNRQNRLLQQGAAAGIMATTIRELAAAAATERNDLELARLRHQQLSDKVRSLENQKLYLEENIRATGILAAELAQEVSVELERLAVPSLDEFSQRLEQFNRAQAICDELHQSLETAFQQAPIRTGDWQSLFQQVPIPPDPGVTFAPEKLAQLRNRREEAAAEIEELQESLSLHRAALNQFAAACQGLPLEKETDCRLTTHFADLEILDYGVTVLESFAAKVNAEFNTASGLMDILETLEAEEQEKMADLLGPEKPVQGIFRTITGNRYTQVKLDSDLNILVEKRDGLELPASALSQGTFDQLYLALRLSLAQDLLAGRPGFLLLDDAYLCADSARLDRMLDLLTQLAAQGWQILYFTMDERLQRAQQTAGAVTVLEPLLPE